MEMSYWKSHLSSEFWLHAKMRYESLSFDLNKSLITGDELQFQVVSDRCSEASIFKAERHVRWTRMHTLCDLSDLIRSFAGILEVYESPCLREYSYYLMCQWLVKYRLTGLTVRTALKTVMKGDVNGRVFLQLWTLLDLRTHKHIFLSH